MFVREGVSFGGKELSIETGRMAKQADGSVVVRYGDTMVLVTAVASWSVRPGVDFMPLTVDYLEKTSAAGRIPGGYFKREGRMTEVEVLTSRLIDRPSRPLFPKGWRFDTQVIAMVVSTDRENGSDVLAMTGASTALHLSDIPWAGPYAGVRVGRIDGKFIINPTFAERATSELDLIVAASRDAIVMVEGGGAEVSEEVIVDALMFAHQSAQPLIDLQEKLRAAVGKPKREFVPPVKDPAIVSRVAELANQKIEAAMAIREKHERYAALDSAGTETKAALVEAFPDRGAEVGEAFESAKKKHLRELVLNTGRRIDGRAPADIRTITCEVGVLAADPRLVAVHPRRDPGAGHDHAGHQPGHAAHRRHHRGHREALPAALQLPALFDGRDQAAARRQPARGRPRPPGGAGHRPRAARRKGVPLHDPDRVGDPRVERQLVDGVGLRRHPVADGRRRADQDAGGRHRDGV